MAEELKITSMEQVATILRALAEAMDAEEDDKEEEDTEKSANVIDRLISTIHSNYTQAADWMYGDGIFSQADRIALSGAIGVALDAFNKFIDENGLGRLRTTDPYPLLKSDVITFEAEELCKADEEMVAYSIAYPAMPPDWKDSQSDRIEEPEIRKMAWRWMLESERYDVQHRILDVAKEDAAVVESFIAPVDIDWPTGENTVKRVNKGSWIVATKFSPKLWAKVRKGELNAYSIRGKAKRIKVQN